MGSPQSIKRIFWTASALCVILFFLACLEFYIRIKNKTPAYRVGWYFRGNSEQANEWGARGRKASSTGASTLLLLGDSQVEARAQEMHDMPEAVLERVLQSRGVKNVRVASLGESGWAQDQELLALQSHLHQIDPKWTVLWLTSHNDLWGNTFPTDMPINGNPKPTFWLENGELKGPHLEWLSLHANHFWHIWRYLSFRLGDPGYPSDSAWESKLPPPYSSLARPTEKVPHFLECLKSVYHEETAHWVDHDQYENFKTEKTHFSILLDPPSARMDYSIQLTRRLIQQIQNELKKQGSDLLIAYAPNVHFQRLFEIYGDSFTMQMAGGYYRLSKKSEWENVSRIVAGFPNVLLKDLPPHSEVSFRNSHLNNRGIEAMMKAVADYTTRPPSGWFALTSR